MTEIERQVRRLRELDRLTRRHLGLSLSAYPVQRVRALLAALPDREPRPTPAVMQTLITTLCIGETMFLRHAEHFDMLRRVMPRITETLEPEATLRVWSAGCATGEEAYSLAAVLGREYTGPVEVIGTDVNPAFLERAREARYRTWSLRGLAPASVRTWLEVDEEGIQVDESTRRAVDFRVLNLVGGPYPEGIHVIFCRNVLLYFAPSSAQFVYREMAASAAPEAHLFLGPGDPQPGPESGWVPEEHGRLACFRLERSRGAPPLARPHRRPPPPVASEPPLAAARELLEELERLDSAGDVQEGLRLARDLANQRRVDEALEHLGGLIAAGCMEVRPYTLGAWIAEDAGRNEEALAMARKARFLEPDGVVTNYLLGVALGRTGHPREAGRHFRRAREALGAIPDLSAEVPHGEGMTGYQMDRLLAGRLSDE